MSMFFSRDTTKETERGYSLVVVVLIFTGASAMIMAGVMAPIIKDIRNMSLLSASKASFALAEGAAEELAQRVKVDLAYDSNELLNDGYTIASTTVSVVSGNVEVISEGNTRDVIRKLRLELTDDFIVPFRFAAQADTGGFVLRNSSKVEGSAYSNGTIDGMGWSKIGGDAVSAGPAGSVSDIHASGSVYALNIEDSVVDQDAFYQTIDVSTTVAGIEYPGSPYIPTTPLPLADADVESWKELASSTGIITSPCPYIINTDMTLGPVKIECDVEIKGNKTLNLAGPIWIQGSLEIGNSPIVRVDSSVGNISVPVVVDNPADRITSSQISLDQNSDYIGNGTSSYIFLISTNESAQLGGSEIAIDFVNGGTGDLLLYAGHGEIRMRNNTYLREVSAWRIHLENSARVIYTNDLVNTLIMNGSTTRYSTNYWGEVY